MAKCSQCGMDNDNQEFCFECGSRITQYNSKKTHKRRLNLIIDQQMLIKIVVYLTACFAIDLAMVFAVLKGIVTIPKNYSDIGLVAIALIIQVIAYKLIVQTSDLTINSKPQALIYFLIPTLHFAILSAVAMLVINNETIFITLASMLAYGLFIGSIHIYIRVSFVYRNLDEAVLLNKAKTEEITKNLNIKNNRNIDAVGYSSRAFSRFGD